MTEVHPGVMVPTVPQPCGCRVSGIDGEHTDPCTKPDPPAHCRWAANTIGGGR